MTTIDLLIVVLYIAGSVIVGFAAKGKQETADDYFMAGGGLKSAFGTVLVGLSIAATLFSGISFIAYPSVVYSVGLILLMNVMIIGMPVAWLVLRFWFLPRYLALGVKFPYDSIEMRFGVPTRTLAAALFVLMRVGWMAAMIFAPTLAVMAMGNLGQAWFWPLVLIVGLSCTVYTVFGGIRSVIVTDAIQFIVIAVGIAATIAYILVRLPIPLGQAWSELGQSGHLRWLDFSTDLTKPLTFWSVTIGVTVANLANYVGDQMSLQRYLASGGLKSANRSFLINVVGVMLVLVLLAGVGLALHVWYQHMPDPALPQKPDKVFPHFVATRLPVGLAGLLLAAILAATMSSMASGINALAATVTLDFRVRFGGPMVPAQQLRYAKISSLLVGLASTAVAGFVDRLGMLFLLIQVLLGVFAGPLLTCVMLSVARTRINGAAMFLGMIVGCTVGAVVAWTNLSELWVSPFGAVAALVTAWVASAVLPPRKPQPVPLEAIAAPQAHDSQ